MGAPNFLLFSMIFLLMQQCVHYAESQDDLSQTAENSKSNAMPSKVIVTSWNDMPFSGIHLENGTWVGSGYAFDILNMLRTNLNFTYTIIPPSEHVLGTKTTGILGLLFQNKVDIAVAFLPVLPGMRHYCKFSIGLEETRLSAMIKRPKESANNSGLLAPFDRNCWLLVLASLLFVGPVIYIFAHFRAKLKFDKESEKFSLFSCLWFVYSSLLKQGTPISATTDSTRMLFATWWIFILILTSFYTANLTAFLTKPQFTLPINSLQDIIQKGYSWTAEKGDIVEFLISHARHDKQMRLLNGSLHRGKGSFLSEDSNQAILQSVSEKKVFFGYEHNLELILFESYRNKTHDHVESRLRCTHVIMPESTYDVSRAFAFPLNSAIWKIINEKLLRMLETGIVKRYKDQGVSLAKICPVDLRPTERKLRNNDLLLTYAVILGGYTIAVTIFLLEIFLTSVLKHLKHRKKEGTCAKTGKLNRKKPMVSRVIPIKSNDHLSLEKQGSCLKKSPKPMYENVRMNNLRQRKVHYINGRTYYVVLDSNGDQRLIPIRTPSAVLFQYS